MKKTIFILVVSAMFLTGCMNKESTVACTRSTDLSGFVMEEKNQTVIRNNKAYSTDLEIVAIPEEAYKDYLNEYAQALDEGFINIKDAKGVTYSSEIKDGKHTLKMSIVYSKLDENEISKFNANEKEMVSDRDTKNASAKATKESLEKEGYTCEIK